MFNLSIQPYFHPTTIVMLDDNQRFLENFNLYLDEKLACRFFSSANDCLNFFLDQRKRIPLDRRCFSYYRQPQGGLPKNRVIRFDLTLIEQEISNADRFHDISVVIVDYDMPEMTGLEFCRRLKNPRIKKILLTGVADEKIAVEAFNAGIIDHFIMKSDPNITSRINKVIQDLQKRYFSEMSSLIQSTLDLESPDFLYDEDFIAFFFDIVKKNKVAEYYYVEDPQGFLMVSEQGKLWRLIVQTNRDLESAAFHIKTLAPPEWVMRGIASRKLAPWLWATPDEFDESEDFQWEDFMHKTRQVKGQETWHCALVESPPVDIEYDVSTSSYSAYLEYLDKP